MGVQALLGRWKEAFRIQKEAPVGDDEKGHRERLAKQVQSATEDDDSSSTSSDSPSAADSNVVEHTPPLEGAVDLEESLLFGAFADDDVAADAASAPDVVESSGAAPVADVVPAVFEQL